MKKSSENSKPNCEDIQRLLVNKVSDELTRDEDRLLEGHLKSCGHCRVLRLRNR